MTSSNTGIVDSQCNTPSSVYDTKPESTDAPLEDDTQIMAAPHMNVTFESKKWIFIGIVTLIVLLVAAASIVVLLVANSRGPLAVGRVSLR